MVGDCKRIGGGGREKGPGRWTCLPSSKRSACNTLRICVAPKTSAPSKQGEVGWRGGAWDTPITLATREWHDTRYLKKALSSEPSQPQRLLSLQHPFWGPCLAPHRASVSFSMSRSMPMSMSMSMSISIIESMKTEYGDEYLGFTNLHLFVYHEAKFEFEWNLARMMGSTHTFNTIMLVRTHAQKIAGGTYRRSLLVLSNWVSFWKCKMNERAKTISLWLNSKLPPIQRCLKLHAANLYQTLVQNANTN